MYVHAQFYYKNYTCLFSEYVHCVVNNTQQYKSLAFFQQMYVML